MSNKIKDFVLIFTFLTLIMGFAIVNFITEDKTVSESERRKLTMFPKFTLESFIDGKFVDTFEKYTLDQFVFRDTFRKVKAQMEYLVFGKKDNNGIFIVDEEIYKVEYPLNEKSINNAINKFNKLKQMYFRESDNVYYTIVPDKNYYLQGNNNYLTMDYDKLFRLFNIGLKDMKYIDITKKLSIDDYYRTDIHWK